MVTERSFPSVCRSQTNIVATRSLGRSGGSVKFSTIPVALKSHNGSITMDTFKKRLVADCWTVGIFSKTKSVWTWSNSAVDKHTFGGINTLHLQKLAERITTQLCFYL